MEYKLDVKLFTAGKDNTRDKVLEEIFNPDDNPPPMPRICFHKNKYKNKISNTLEFWVCPDCKEELDQWGRTKPAPKKDDKESKKKDEAPDILDTDFDDFGFWI